MPQTQDVTKIKTIFNVFN